MADTFALDLQRFQKHVQLSAVTIVKKVSFDILRGVLEKTPVDTGRALGSWNIGVGQQNDAIPQEGESYLNTSAQLAAASAELGRMVDTPVQVFINSNLDYMEYLEDGSSTQAPHGMLGVTLSEIGAHYSNGL